jgi:hypothetical protein
MECFIRTKELPLVGVFKHAREYLYQEKIWEIEVRFQEKISQLGCSYDDRSRTDVIAFDNNGLKGSWNGKYGGSTAVMFENNMAAKATAGKISTDVPDNVIILEIIRSHKGSWVRAYLNPSHQNKLLAKAPENIDMKRASTLLKVFKGLKPAYRHDELHRLQATTKELRVLVENNWLKCHKGKKIFKYDCPEYIGKYPITYRHYEFGGAKITTEGKNIVISNT